MYAGDGTTGLPQAGDGSDRAKYLPVYWMSFCVLLCEPRRLRPCARAAAPRRALRALGISLPRARLLHAASSTARQLATRQRAMGHGRRVRSIRTCSVIFVVCLLI